MKRQDKYPDTKTFHFFNANPKNRYTTDCVIRAISTANNIPYNQVVMDFAKIQCETGYDASSNHGIDRLLESYGWEKFKQPRRFDNTKYTGKEFCKGLQTEISDGLEIDGSGAPLRRIIAKIGSHHIVAIIDGVIQDIVDCSDGRIGNIWMKF